MSAIRSERLVLPLDLPRHAAWRPGFALATGSRVCNAGQTCRAGSRLVAQRPVREALLERIEVVAIG